MPALRWGTHARRRVFCLRVLPLSSPSHVADTPAQPIAFTRNAREALGAARMRMTVIDCRDELVAYYVRRGYVRTGVFKSFPYDDPRYGVPKRPDLRFEVLEKPLTETAA